MKGWVYVISNIGMPGLVKVGYSTKDPELRAEELNHTGSPHPYVVDYEVLIEEPFEIEQKAHRLLASKHEAKEWFRCSAEEAVAAIKQVSSTQVITETYKRAERAKAETLHRRELEEQEIRRQREKAEKDLEERLRNEEAIIQKQFDEQIAASFPPRPFWNYWLGSGILVGVSLAIFFPKMSDSAVSMAAAFVGALVAWWVQEYWEGKRKQSSAYLALEKQRDAKLATVRVRGSHHAVVEAAVIGKRDEKLATVRGGTPTQPLRQQVEPTNENNEAKSQEQADVQRYRQAAMQGIPSAQVFLGMMYLNGTRLPQDDAQAVTWFRKAAKQGNAEGQYRLGWMYKIGRGVLQDTVKAHMWGSLAVWNGESRAGEMCDELVKQMTPSQLAQAKAMAQTCQASNYKHC